MPLIASGPGRIKGLSSLPTPSITSSTMEEIASKDANHSSHVSSNPGNFSEKPDAVKINMAHTARRPTTAAVENGSDIGLKPVSFRSLFRFSTRLELFLDSIGVCAAVIAGAAQVRSFVLSSSSCLLSSPLSANVLLNTKHVVVFLCAFSPSWPSCSVV